MFTYKKSISFIIILLFSTVAILAQDQYKPLSGDKTLEVQFSPLGGSPINVGGIRVRQFNSDDIAYRLNVFAGFNNVSTKDQDVDGQGNNVYFNDATNSFNLVVRPGLEKHMEGTDRLSPYFGAEALLGFSMESDRNRYLDANFDTQSITTRNSTVSIGVSGLAGVDFYFAESFYLGAEFGIGIQIDDDLGTRTSYSEDGAAPDPNDPTPRGSSFNFGPLVNGQIRLGWVF